MAPQGRSGGCARARHRPPRGLAHGEEQADGGEADQPEHVEADAPAEARRDPSGDAEAERGADRQPGIVDAGGQAEPARGKGVAQHRQRRRRERGLADADQHARQGQVDEAARRARQGGHDAPQPEAPGDDRAPRPAVGGDTEQHAHQRVEDDEGEADEQADLRPAEAEVGDEQRRQARDELPVDEIEDVERRHHAEQHPRGSRHGSV